MSRTRRHSIEHNESVKSITGYKRARRQQWRQEVQLESGGRGMSHMKTASR